MNELELNNTNNSIICWRPRLFWMVQIRVKHTLTETTGIPHSGNWNQIRKTAIYCEFRAFMVFFSANQYASKYIRNCWIAFSEKYLFSIPKYQKIHRFFCLFLILLMVGKILMVLKYFGITFCWNNPIFVLIQSNVKSGIHENNRRYWKLINYYQPVTCRLLLHALWLDISHARYKRVFFLKISVFGGKSEMGKNIEKNEAINDGISGKREAVY